VDGHQPQAQARERLETDPPTHRGAQTGERPPPALLCPWGHEPKRGHLKAPPLRPGESHPAAAPPPRSARGEQAITPIRLPPLGRHPHRDQTHLPHTPHAEAPLRRLTRTRPARLRSMAAAQRSPRRLPRPPRGGAHNFQDGSAGRSASVAMTASAKATAANSILGDSRP